MPIENSPKTEQNKTQLPQEEKNRIRQTNTFQGSDEFTFYPAVAISAIFAGKAILADTLRKTALMSCGAIVSALAVPPKNRDMEVRSSKERLFASQLPIFAGTALSAVFIGKAVFAKGVVKTALMSFSAMTTASAIVPASTSCLNPEVKDLESFADSFKGKVFQIKDTAVASLPDISSAAVVSLPDIPSVIKGIFENIGNSNTPD